MRSRTGNREASDEHGECEVRIIPSTTLYLIAEQRATRVRKLLGFFFPTQNCSHTVL